MGRKESNRTKKIVKELADKGQIQYLTYWIKWASRGDLPVCNIISFTKIDINNLSKKYLNPSWDRFIAPCKEVKHIITT